MSLQLLLPLIGFLVVATSAAVLIFVVWTEGNGESLENALRKSLHDKVRPQEVLTVEDFGLIEKDFPNLTEVIIVCHMVEKPQASLRDAVIDNFIEGVRYRFCVSKSNYAAARRNYSDYFEAIFKVAQSECANSSQSEICDLEFSNLFEIAPLRGEWSAWPYVFYVHVEDDGETGIVAYRGDQQKEGIANNYVKLRPTETRTILNAINMSIDGEHELVNELVSSASFGDRSGKVEAA